MPIRSINNKMKGVTRGRGGVWAKRGRILQSVAVSQVDQGVLRQGVIWRHSRREGFCWQPASNDLRRVDTGRWCDAAVQTLRF